MGIGTEAEPQRSPPDTSRAGVPLHRLLVCLARAPYSEAVLPYAVALARGFGSRIDVVHVLEDGGTRQPTETSDALDCQLARAEAERYVERVVADLKRQGVTASGSVLQGHVAEQILCFTHRQRVDLVVLCSHGEKGPTEWNLGSSAEKIVARAYTSVLVVPVHGDGERPAEGFALERVLVPLDGSPRAECVLPLVERMAHDHSLQILLLHAVTRAELLDVDPPSAQDLGLLRDLELRNERAARRYLARVHERLARAGCEVRELIEVGDVLQIVPRLAACERIDLLAIAAHGRTGRRNASFGATAGHLIRHPGIPVLMVQNLPQTRSAFAQEVLHRREELPLRGSERAEQS